jgi:2'-5' RNA ligase
MNACIPLIVALEIEKSIKNAQIIFDLNKSCMTNKGIDFVIHRPHISLWMGFVEKNELESLQKSFYKVFNNIQLEVQITNAIVFIGIDGNVLSLNIDKTKRLAVLQNRIHHFFEPYRMQVENHKDFSLTTLSYVNQFKDKSLENFDPHITVGFSDKKINIEPFSLNLKNPKIFLMGNNCTCLEVISS